MEEILSSIKRIIAEDSEAAMAPPKTGKRAVVAAAPDPLPTPPEEPEVLELTETVEVQTVPNEQPVTVQAAPDPSPAAVEAKPTLVSDAATEASRSRLAALSALVVKPEVTGSDTLEGIVREMLKPMLAEWLDAKLPDVVERMVAREISRITDKG